MTSEPHGSRLRDPVCGMTVDPTRARGGLFEFNGTTYGFCSPGCRQKFIADPEGWLVRGATPMGAPLTIGRPATTAPSALPLDGPFAGTPRPAAPSPSGNTAAADVYICPMHPQVTSVGPGDCPICGMALEPRAASAAEPDNGERLEMERRLWVAASLSVPVVALSMLGMFDPMGAWRSWAEMLLAAPVVTWCAWPFYGRAMRSLRHGHLNMFTLIGLGVAAAFVSSLVATIAPSALPAAFHTHGGQPPVYFEAAVAIVTLVLAGQVLELRARRATSSALRQLISLAPPVAYRISASGAAEDVPLDAVVAGDHLRVRAHQRVPVDGVVLNGGSTVDESMVTGESIPVHKQAGDRVIGGTLNGSGTLVIRAEKVGRETLLARIVALVGDAQRSRAPIQRLADAVSSYFVPAVIATALATFIIWARWGPEPRMAYGLVNAVAVLIIACPCALGLATPMSIVVAAGRGAANGILFRDAEAIETLERIDTLVVDKTGTLTQNKPELASVTWLDGFSEQDVLGAAASLEVASDHPLARAVEKGASDRHAVVSPAERVLAVTGKGVTGRVSGRDVAVGSPVLMQQLGVDVAGLAERAEALRADGQIVTFVAIDGRAAGVIGVVDPIKVSALEAMRALRGQGVRLVMLTGDSETTARAVARKLGIDEVRAELLPEQKLEVVRQLQGASRVVAMAGDGVNDAPALAAADVGITLGSGSDVALHTAGVTLVKGDLTAIVRARRLSAITMRNIRQNLFFAFVYNAIGVPIAAGALYPLFGLLLSPMIAAAAMSVSSASVIANALRLRRQSL